MLKYPKNWEKIANRLKRIHNYTCERCKHKDDPQSGYMITVHHLDGNPFNNEHWNLAVLCQRCHLKVQPYAELSNELEQMNFPFYEPAEWLMKHIEGYIEFRKRELSRIDTFDLERIISKENKGWRLSKAEQRLIARAEKQLKILYKNGKGEGTIAEQILNCRIKKGVKINAT